MYTYYLMIADHLSMISNLSHLMMVKGGGICKE